MNKIVELETLFEVKLDGAESKGDKICPCCGTKMIRRLEDLPLSFDWQNKFRERFQVSKLLICNQCFYHILLLLLDGLKNESINVFSLVKAYETSMNLEDVFFDPSYLSCSSIFEFEDFSELEGNDEIQSLYCQVFNNAYDLVVSNGAKQYFQTKNWPEVLAYKRGRFFKMSTKELL